MEAALKARGMAVGRDGSVDVGDDDKTVKLVPKHQLKKRLLEPNDIDMREILSKGLLPDEAVFCESPDECSLHVFEKKFQECEGSVDEKLQTGPFKLHEYKKLAKALEEALDKPVDVTYSYVLGDWFRQERYRDVLEYNEENGIECFFGEVPLSKFL